MNNTDIMYTLRAVEFMSHGIDVSSFDNIDMFKGFVNSKTHKYISKLSENVTDFLIKLDDDCKNILGITSDTVLRHDRNYKLIFPDTPAAEEIAGKEPSISLTKDILVVQLDFDHLVWKVNIKNNQKHLQTLIQKINGYKVRVYGINRRRAVELYGRFQSLYQVGKLPKPETIHIDFKF